ncbi:MAG: VWA domain-containing protein, partial [Candidatus Aenigmarchaeota archaeon]|nr:VWA domain-containing protein [Candidatus Aenigmarchaeota archaeon]
MNTGDNFTLYINGNYSGTYFRNASQTKLRANLRYNITNQTHLSYIVPDENKISIVFLSGNLTNKYIGGGFIKIEYNTSQLNTAALENKYYFPGVDGLLNIYSSFYVPGQVNNMTAFLHYKTLVEGTDLIAYLKIGNSTIFQSNVSGEQNIYINSTDLNARLSLFGMDYASLSQKTSPLRFGYIAGSFKTEESGGQGDAILITDISGSMDECDVVSNCTAGICDAVDPCHKKRINVAKDADKLFVESMLNVSGNRVGLAAFDTNTYKIHQLSTDNISLESQIDTYSPRFSTCLCCGIKSAKEMLIKPYYETPVDTNSTWKYTANYSATEPPNDHEGMNWKESLFNDSNWSLGNSSLGFENNVWNYRLSVNISNTAGNLTNQQVLINLSKINFNFSNAQLKGEDIRVKYFNKTTGNETYISFWTSKFSSVDKVGEIWIKPDFLKNNENTS